MASIKRIKSGARMSQAVVHGDTVYLAGQVATNTAGGSMTDQAKEVLQQIDALLAEAGTDKSKILTANIYILDLATFADLNAVWDAWVSPGNAPTRTTIETKLASPKYAVEIGVVAAV